MVEQVLVLTQLAVLVVQVEVLVTKVAASETELLIRVPMVVQVH